MSGALLLHCAPRSRTPAEAAAGSADNIAQIAAFAWELGNGVISDVLSFPASTQLPQWLESGSNVPTFEISSALTVSEVTEVAKVVGARIKQSKPVRLVCHETFGKDLTAAYLRGLTSVFCADGESKINEQWPILSGYFGGAGGPLSLVVTSTRSLSAAPPEVFLDSQSLLQSQNASVLKGALRAAENFRELNRAKFIYVSEERKLSFSNLPAAGGGIAAIHVLLGAAAWKLGEIAAASRKVATALANSSLVISLVDELNSWQTADWQHKEIVEKAHEMTIPCILVARNSSLNRMEMADLGLQSRYQLRSWSEPDVVKVFSRLARTWGNV